MSDVAAEEPVEEVWTPKAAAAAKQEGAVLHQRQQPKSAKMSALAGGIVLNGTKSDDNLQPQVFLNFGLCFLAHRNAQYRYVTTPLNGEEAPVDWGQV
jgi:hypothetical protein